MIAHIAQGVVAFVLAFLTLSMFLSLIQPAPEGHTHGAVLGARFILFTLAVAFGLGTYAMASLALGV